MRALVLLVLAACYTPKPGVSKPRALAYNALCVAAGVASVFVGYEIAKQAPSVGDNADDDSGLGGIFVGFIGGGGILGGTLLTFGGLSGLAMTELDLSPTH